MKAIIMAGGGGTRLRPLTCGKPKPMVNLLNKPVISHIIDLLKSHNITEIGVTLQYMPEAIRGYLGDGSAFGVNISYFVEDKPLGTAGSVKNAESFIDGDFLIISGDCMCDADLSEAIAFHQKNRATATLVLSRVKTPLEYGVVITDAEGRITKFLEKPGWSEVFSDTVNTGIYVLSKKILEHIPAGEVFDFSKDLFPLLKNNGEPLFGYISSGYWCDIGDLASYAKCQFDMLNKAVKFSCANKEISKGIWVGSNVNISDGAYISPPVFIGDNVTVEGDAYIGGYSVVGDNSKIFEHSSTKRVILDKSVILDADSELRGCIVCEKTLIGARTHVYEQAVIGQECTVGRDCEIKAGIKIWPQKTVEDNTLINANIVWGAKFSGSLFEESMVSGELNIDITPEFASKLGAAFGLSFPAAAVCYDGSPEAEMIKKAFVSGLMSAGCEAYDFGRQILPSSRAAVKFYSFDGGVYISYTNKRINIDFLSAGGADISREAERKIENAFTREDFSRTEAGNIKDVKNIENYEAYYIRGIINSARNKNMNKKIYIDTDSQPVYNICGEILRRLGCGIHFGDHPVKGAVGVRINGKGEIQSLTSEDGRSIDADMYSCIVALVALKSEQGARVVTPLSAPGSFYDMVSRYNGLVINSKTARSDTMSKLLENDLYGQFAMRYDAAAGLVILLDFLCTANMKLAELAEEIPDFHKSTKEVGCNKDSKAKIIKHLAREYADEHIELTEGIKIWRDKGWILVVPDAVSASFKLTAEGFSEEYAEELCDNFAEKIKEIAAAPDER